MSNFHELVHSGAIDAPTPVDQYVEVDKREYAELADSEVDLVRCGMVGMLSPRRLSAEAGKELAYWGYTYYSEVLAEYKRDTSIKAVMGKILKQNIKQDNVNSPALVIMGTTERFERINAAISRMKPNHRNLVHRHYVINQERKDYRNDRKVAEYAKLINVSLRTYERELGEAKQLFIAIHSTLK